MAGFARRSVDQSLRSAAAPVATGADARPTRFGRVWQHVVRRQYVGLTASLPGTEVFYTLKANLAPEVLSLLIKLGSNFDVAKLDARTRDVAAS